MLALWLKNHFPAVRYNLHLLCALQLLVLTLCVTPRRRVLSGAAIATQRRWGKRLADWNWLVRLRRPLGLWSFAYAALHAAFYLHFDLGYDAAAALDEVQQKPYLLAGLGTLLLLLLLALTSPQAMVRRLGRQWRRLHRLVYVAALLALLHFWWLVKPGLWTPWPETLALGLLLGYRAGLWVSLLPRWDGCDGSESLQRVAGPPHTFPA